MSVMLGDRETGTCGMLNERLQGRYYSSRSTKRVVDVPFNVLPLLYFVKPRAFFVGNVKIPQQNSALQRTIRYSKAL